MSDSELIGVLKPVQEALEAIAKMTPICYISADGKWKYFPTEDMFLEAIQARNNILSIWTQTQVPRDEV